MFRNALGHSLMFLACLFELVDQAPRRIRLYARFVRLELIWWTWVRWTHQPRARSEWMPSK